MSLTLEILSADQSHAVMLVCLAAILAAGGWADGAASRNPAAV